MEKKRIDLMHFPNFKTSLKLGAIVLGTSLIISTVIVAIDYGMSLLLNLF